MRKIRPNETVSPRMQDVSKTLRRLKPARIAKALDAESYGLAIEASLAPLTVAAVRAELIERLKSRGGRPALAKTGKRAKIPLNDQQWLQLETLAANVAERGFSPSAGQVASVLLSSALRYIVRQTAAQKPSAEQWHGDLRPANTAS